MKPETNEIIDYSLSLLLVVVWMFLLGSFMLHMMCALLALIFFYYIYCFVINVVNVFYNG